MYMLTIWTMQNICWNRIWLKIYRRMKNIQKIQVGVISLNGQLCTTHRQTHTNKHTDITKIVVAFKASSANQQVESLVRLSDWQQLQQKRPKLQDKFRYLQVPVSLLNYTYSVVICGGYLHIQLQTPAEWLRIYFLEVIKRVLHHRL